MQVLDMQDQEDVSGGVNWSQVGVGVAVFSLAVGIAATGGLGGIAVAAIWGAGMGADFAIAGTALTLAGTSGATIGLGMKQ